eukprot:741145_1
MTIDDEFVDASEYYKGIAEGHDSICIRVAAFCMAYLLALSKDVFSFLRKPSNWLPSLAFIFLPAQICFYIAATYGPWELLNTIKFGSAEVQPHNWEMWRFLTSSLTHRDWEHLIGNCFYQLTVFFWVQADLGATWRMLVVCVLTAWGGQTFNLMRMTTHGASVGSSHMGYGVASAELTFLILNWPTTRWAYTKMAYLLGITVPEIKYVFMPHIIAQADDIGHTPHAGSQVIGLLVGAAISE